MRHRHIQQHHRDLIASIRINFDRFATSCRFWDIKTNERLDKDRFRHDMGKVEEAYQEIARRLGILPESGPSDLQGPSLMQ